MPAWRDAPGGSAGDHASAARQVEYPVAGTDAGEVHEHPGPRLEQRRHEVALVARGGHRHALPAVPIATLGGDGRGRLLAHVIAHVTTIPSGRGGDKDEI